MNQVKRILLIASLFVPLVSIAAAQDRIEWVTDLSQARRLAQQQQRLVLLHFWSDDCAPCRVLDQSVFNQPELIRVIATSYVPVKINAFQQTRFADFYHIERVPTDVIVLPNGKEIYRSTSPPKMNDYIAMLDHVRAKAITEHGLYTDVIANTSLPPMEPSLPAASPADPSDQQTSEPINSDPRAVFDNGPSQPSRTRSPWQATAPDATPPQRAVVQNQYTNPSSSAPQTADASTVSRTGNPYLNNETSLPTATPPESSPPPPSQPNAQDATGSAPADAAPDANPQSAPGAPTQSLDAPPISLDGYCPVTLVVMSKWTKGDPRWGVTHRGRTYLMATEVERDRFMSDPDRYSPALSGFDPVRFAESRQLVNGKREWGVYYDKSFYLFADEAALKRFEQQPARYVAAVRQAMAAGRPNQPQR